MAKYFYEKWDMIYNTDSLEIGYLTSGWELDESVSRIKNNGQPRGGIVKLQRLALRSLFTNPLDTSIQAYNGNKRNFAIMRADETSNRCFVMASTKSEIIASIKPTTLIDTIIAEEGTYPDDGIQGDFWYIKKGLVETFPAVHVKVGTAIKKATKGYVKTGGVLKEIKEIYTKSGGVLKKAK